MAKPNLKRMMEIQSDINKRLKGVVEGDLFESLGVTKEYIPSGNYMLNAMMTGDIFKGAPDSRIMQFAGAPESGKTFVCLNYAIRLCELGFIVWYLDTEGALDDEVIAKFSPILAEAIKIKQFSLIRKVNTYTKALATVHAVINMKKEYLEEYKAEIKAKAKSKSKDSDEEEVEELKLAIVLDSYAQLCSDKENDDGTSGKGTQDMGSRAKQGRSFFRQSCLDLSNLNIPLFVTNQTSDNLTMYSTEGPKVIGGGGGSKFGSTYIFEFNKKTLTNNRQVDGVERSGILVDVKSRKNRFVKSHQFEMIIEPDRPWNAYKGLEDFVVVKDSKGMPKAEFIENSWELFGLALGTIYTEKEFADKYKGADPVNSKKIKLKTHKFEKDGATYYCVENPDCKPQTVAVKDTCKNIPDMKKWLLTKHIFTEGTLKMLNENVIKPYFEFKNEDTGDDVDDAMDLFATEGEE